MEKDWTASKRSMLEEMGLWRPSGVRERLVLQGPAQPRGAWPAAAGAGGGSGSAADTSVIPARFRPQPTAALGPEKSAYASVVEQLNDKRNEMRTGTGSGRFPFLRKLKGAAREATREAAQKMHQVGGEDADEPQWGGVEDAFEMLTAITGEAEG